MFGLPLQPNRHQSNAAQMAQHMKCAIKGERKERERQKGEKMRDQIAKKKKKNNYNLQAHTFSPRDPCDMTFRECKIWQCLIVKKNISTFVFK